MSKFNFEIIKQAGLARTGRITTPHGDIHTPAFIPVATQAAMKALKPEDLTSAGAQALLVNAYHLYLRPGSDIVRQAGGIGNFMNWKGPSFSDSGGFQVMSLGMGFKKIVNMTTQKLDTAGPKEKMAWIDDEGVTFKSHIDGSKHRFTPEISIDIQHEIGADIIFTFDELTTLQHSRKYQEESLDKRTHPWAERCLTRHKELNSHKKGNYQALFGVIQGAQYEDLRRKSARFMAARDFDGFGLGGALTKENLGEIIRWMVEELPTEKPRHMLGISEPDDIFACIANGADTFDCVSPARLGRNGALYLSTGRINITNQKFKSDFNKLDQRCDCYTCANYSRAYLHHLYKSGELLAFTLGTIHNERFILRLVDGIRDSINNDHFMEFQKEWLERYY